MEHGMVGVGESGAPGGTTLMMVTVTAVVAGDAPDAVIACAVLCACSIWNRFYVSILATIYVWTKSNLVKFKFAIMTLM
jgi:hypothetical protein